MPFTRVNHNSANKCLDHMTANKGKTFSAQYFNTHEYTMLIKT